MLSLFPELADFGPEDYARIGTARPVIMIAMTARTGSTLLMGGLSQALGLGNPSDMTEIFNARHILPWLKNTRKLETFGDVLQNYVAHSGSYVVFKTNWQDFAFFKESVGAMFPNLKVLYLDRLSVEAQAVSVVKAMESNLWHTTDQAAVKQQRANAAEIGARFDLVKICGMIESILKEKNNWERYFFDTGIEPARLIYEGFSGNLQAGIDRVARAIGLDPASLPRVNPYFKQLADEVNDDWIKRTKNYRTGAFYARVMAERQRHPAGSRNLQA